MRLPRTDPPTGDEQDDRTLSRARRRRSASGSVSVLVLAVVVLTAGLAAGLTRVGDAALRAARADAVADLSALAAAAGGTTAAAEVASAGGGRLVSHVATGVERHVVVVEFDGASSTAAAAPGP